MLRISEKSLFSAPPLSGVTPHIVERCHEVTEGTATVSGCLRSRLRGSQKTLLKRFLSFRLLLRKIHLPHQRESSSSLSTLSSDGIPSGQFVEKSKLTIFAAISRIFVWRVKFIYLEFPKYCLRHQLPNGWHQP